MGVIEMTKATARLRQLPGHCRQCGGTSHTSEEHAEKTAAINRGRKFSKEHRQRLSVSHQGLGGCLKDPKAEAERRRKLRELKLGKPLSRAHRKACSRGRLKEIAARRAAGDETIGMASTPAKERLRRMKISQAQRCRETPWQIGPKHWHWKGGGKRYRHYGHHFRSMRGYILARDKQRCVICRRKKAEVDRLCVHHINHHTRKKDSNIHNLVTLCNPCNIKAERKKNYYAWQQWLTIYTQEANQEMERKAA